MNQVIWKDQKVKADSDNSLKFQRFLLLLFFFRIIRRVSAQFSNSRYRFVLFFYFIWCRCKSGQISRVRSGGQIRLIIPTPRANIIKDSLSTEAGFIFFFDSIKIWICNDLISCKWYLIKTWAQCLKSLFTNFTRWEKLIWQFVRKKKKLTSQIWTHPYVWTDFLYGHTSRKT